MNPNHLFEIQTYADAHSILTKAAAMPQTKSVTVEVDAGKLDISVKEALEAFADLAPGESFIIHSINFTTEEN